MTAEFKYLMHLLAAASTGNPAREPRQKIDWEKLILIAGEQKILPLTAYAIGHFDHLGCPDSLRQCIVDDMKSFAVRNYINRYRIVKLLEDMEKAGICYVLLKGYAVAGYYFAPECRISSDTDILVKPADEEQACRFLSKRGFAVTGRSKNAHHSVCRHPELGVIELHVRLFDKIVEEVWFKKTGKYQIIQEPYQRLPVEDVCFRTLGHTDHMIYLSLHMAKHFIVSGLSLSMIMDMAVYFKVNKKWIDTERFWLRIKSLKYDGLVNCVFTAAIRYMDFQAADFPGICIYDSRVVDLVLTDLEGGGWLGKKDKRAREDGWHEYNRQKLQAGQTVHHYKLYMFRWLFHELWYEFFPSRQQLLKYYPHLRQKPWLFPLIWGHRVFVSGLKSLITGGASRRIVGDENNIGAVGRERIRLFQMLKMI